MDKIVLKAAAKVNLYLKITGVRSDGYHNLDTLMSSVDIYDEITVSKRDDELINCFTGTVKSGANNTAYKAAELVSAAFNTKGADIFIKKNIPYSAGLGGSSADAAGVLYAMDKLFDLGGLKNLENIALSIGSDVPFMLYGGSARILGKGEKVEKTLLKLKYKLLIIKGRSGLSTKAVYSQYDKISASKLKNDKFDYNLNFENINSFTNDLQTAAVSLCPEIENNIKLLENSGAAKSLMTGSGSAVYGLFDNYEVLQKAYKELKNKVYYCRIANFINEGIK